MHFRENEAAFIAKLVEAGYGEGLEAERVERTRETPNGMGQELMLAVRCEVPGASRARMTWWLYDGQPVVVRVPSNAAADDLPAALKPRAVIA